MPTEMTYEESLHYLNQFINYETQPRATYDHEHFDLTNFSAFLDALGAPHRALPSILIAGSKGKGSTAAMIAAMLSQAGLRTGLYTSPHLVTIRERVQIDRQLISPDAFAALMSELRAHLAFTTAKPEQTFRTFFELLTALAFLYFARQQVDIMVVEVGLGGRLDSTNVLTPSIAVITPIGFEHTHILGQTLSAIANEKAGIIKPHGEVIMAPQEPQVLEVVEKRCERQQATLYDASRTFTWCQLETVRGENRIHFHGFDLDLENLLIPLLGQHQAINAAVALAVLGRLRQQGWRLEAQHLRQGLAGVLWEGRLEVIDRQPLVVLDAAHTIESARYLAKALTSLFSYQRLHLILGFSGDKKIHDIVNILAPIACTTIASSFSNPRAFDPNQLAIILRSSCSHVQTAPDPASALTLARAHADPEDLICITGSLLLLGELKARLAGQSLEF
ncbi:MAG: bifunctional folylpolyglutamate synthase/dihydrofolate synthase [bacterium]|nr:bifunctional folylpolyglutamate synthase/dihydrofolate synthase [bacterium]